MRLAIDVDILDRISPMVRVLLFICCFLQQFFPDFYHVSGAHGDQKVMAFHMGEQVVPRFLRRVGK